MFLLSMSNLSAQSLYFTTKKADRKISVGQIEKGQFLYEKVTWKRQSLFKCKFGYG